MLGPRDASGHSLQRRRFRLDTRKSFFLEERWCSPRTNPQGGRASPSLLVCRSPRFLSIGDDPSTTMPVIPAL